MAYFTFTRIGTHWHGRGSLKKLIVFGDSYSCKLSGAWETDEDDAYNIDEDTTWVDFLASSHSESSEVVLNNFAFPGATVEYDLADQLARFFGRFRTKEVEPEKAIYCFFLGINDCGGVPGEDLTSLVENLFDAVHQLYVDAGARNFILVDVPPTDRSPAAVGTTVDVARRIAEWNDSLAAHASKFASNNADVTTLVFSSHKVLSEVLDDPAGHGFVAKHANLEVGRGIWRDSLHLSREVHEIIARRLLSAVLG